MYDNRFRIYDVVDYLSDNTITYVFSDDTSETFNIADFYNFLNRKANKTPSISNDSITLDNANTSFNKLWLIFNKNTKDSYTKIKDALNEEYNILDNYNGVTSATTTDTYNKSDTLSFANRADTTTLNNTDTLSFNDRTDTETHNNSDTLSFNNRLDTQTNNLLSTDTLNDTTTTTTSGQTQVDNYSVGFNGETPKLASRELTTRGGDDLDNEVSEVARTGTDSTADTGTVTNAKAGSEVNSHSGTISNAKTGSEVNSHSGTITNGKSGSEVNAQSGTITHSYSETKRGNLGVTTSQQMLLSELSLRGKYNIRDVIINGFIDKFFYL